VDSLRGLSAFIFRFRRDIITFTVIVGEQPGFHFRAERERVIPRKRQIEARDRVNGTERARYQGRRKQGAESLKGLINQAFSKLNLFGKQQKPENK